MWWCGHSNSNERSDRSKFECSKNRVFVLSTDFFFRLLEWQVRLATGTHSPWLFAITFDSSNKLQSHADSNKCPIFQLCSKLTLWHLTDLSLPLPSHSICFPLWSMTNIKWSIEHEIPLTNAMITEQREHNEIKTKSSRRRKLCVCVHPSSHYLCTITLENKQPRTAVVVGIQQ